MSYIGNTSTQQSYSPTVDYFSGNGSTTAFTLSRPAASVADVQVTIDNVAQNPSSAYTVSGSTITFTSAPLSGTNNIYVRYTSPITQVIAPGQGTVTSDSFGTITNFTTTGNTVLGDATTDTLTVGVTGIVKDSSGNVGIGTASPSYKLDITGQGRATTGFAVSADGSTFTPSGLNAIPNYGVGYITSTSQTTLSGFGGIPFYTNQVERMRIDSSGNVGIGTTSPGSKLYTQLSSATAYSSGVTGNGLTIYNSSATTNQYVGITLQGEPTTGNGGLATIMGTTTGSGNMDLTFSTRASATLAERMRIASDGKVFVGTGTDFSDNPQQGLILYAANNNSQLAVSHGNGTSSGTFYAKFVYNAGSIGTITQNGTTAVAYNTSSDYRLKENIAPLTGALAKVAQLKPVTYTWKSSPEETGEGFIAHELSEVCPQAVHGTKDEVDTDGNPKYQGIDTSFLVATLTAAIQELKAINDTQAETINALTARIEALENK